MEKKADFAGNSRELLRSVSLKNDWYNAADFVGASRANFAGNRLVLRCFEERFQ